MIDVATQYAAYLRPLLRHLAETKDGAKDVVEIMRDSARQRAERLEALRLLQSLLEGRLLEFLAFAITDVYTRTEQARRLAVTTAQAASAHVDPAPFATALYAIVELDGRRAVGQMILDGCLHGRDIVGMQRHPPSELAWSQHIAVVWQAVQSAPFGRQEQRVLCDVPFGISFVGGIHRHRISVLALAQRERRSLDALQLL